MMNIVVVVAAGGVHLHLFVVAVADACIHDNCDGGGRSHLPAAAVHNDHRDWVCSVP